MKSEKITAKVNTDANGRYVCIFESKVFDNDMWKGRYLISEGRGGIYTHGTRSPLFDKNDSRCGKIVSLTKVGSSWELVFIPKGKSKDALKLYKNKEIDLHIPVSILPVHYLGFKVTDHLWLKDPSMEIPELTWNKFIATPKVFGEGEVHPVTLAQHKTSISDVLLPLRTPSYGEIQRYLEGVNLMGSLHELTTTRTPPDELSHYPPLDEHRPPLSDVKTKGVTVITTPSKEDTTFYDVASPSEGWTEVSSLSLDNEEKTFSLAVAAATLKELFGLNEGDKLIFTNDTLELYSRKGLSFDKFKE